MLRIFILSSVIKTYYSLNINLKRRSHTNKKRGHEQRKIGTPNMVGCLFDYTYIYILKSKCVDLQNV